MNIVYALLPLILFAELASSNNNSKENEKYGLETLSGRATRTNEVGIYHGVKTNIRHHPYMVGILLDGAYSCTGTIIGKRWVITLADCTNGVNTTLLTVVTGSEDGVNGTQHAVQEVIVHPDYGSSALDYDYSLLKLSKSLSWTTTTRAVHLPSHEPQGKVRMTVVGYGYTSKYVASSGLRQGKMTWLTNTTCEGFFSALDVTWTDRMACAYSHTQGTTLCEGDFGDPFVRNGRYYGHFIGGVSSGFCSHSAKPVILAGIYPVVSWITNNTGVSP